MPDTPSAAVPTLAATRQATNAPRPKKAAMSCGSFSTSGWRTARRTSRVPTMACNAAPAPSVIGTRMWAARGASGPISTQFSAAEPSPTPSAARGPYVSTQASARPAAGNSGDA